VDRLWATWEQAHGHAYAGREHRGPRHRRRDVRGLLRVLGRDIGDSRLASGTLRPEDLLDPALGTALPDTYSSGSPRAGALAYPSLTAVPVAVMPLQEDGMMPGL
jgi:hypothetical protein